MNRKRKKYTVINSENKMVCVGTVAEIAAHLKISENQVSYGIAKQDDPKYFKKYGRQIRPAIETVEESSARSYAQYVKDHLENKKADFTVVPCRTGGIEALAVKVTSRQGSTGPRAKRSVKTVVMVPPVERWEFSLLVLDAKINRDMGYHCV